MSDNQEAHSSTSGGDRCLSCGAPLSEPINIEGDMWVRECFACHRAISVNPNFREQPKTGIMQKIRDQQSSGGGEITAIMVSGSPDSVPPAPTSDEPTAVIGASFREGEGENTAQVSESGADPSSDIPSGVERNHGIDLAPPIAPVAPAPTQDERDEQKLWDNTLMDGLENDPYPRPTQDEQGNHAALPALVEGAVAPAPASSELVHALRQVLFVCELESKQKNVDKEQWITCARIITRAITHLRAESPIPVDNQPADALVHAANRCVSAFAKIVDNADGYDKSNLMNAILQATHFGAWTKEQIVEIEREGRNAWKQLRDALTGESKQ